MKSNLLKTSIMIAGITILSKFAGFFRDVMVAKAYGATLVSDAYFYAIQFPSLAIILLGGLGGPFHTATIAVFSKMIPNIEEKPSLKILKDFNIIGADVVELAPDYDTSGCSTAVATKVIRELLMIM